MQNKKRLLKGLLVLALFSAGTQAAVPQNEAQRLLKGGDLTPLGGELKGNGKDIPAWDGGYARPSEKASASGEHLPDLFPDDQVLFTITADNMAQYKEHLTPGLQALFKAYPTTFKVPVYQTRRTAAVPEWLEKNTHKNATRAELVRGGNGIQHAYGGAPFPILSGDAESKGLQAIWNHVTRWRGVFVQRKYSEVAVQRDGSYQLVTAQQEVFFNYYNPKGDESTLENINFFYLTTTLAPPRLAGGAILVHEPIDQVKDPRQAWGYNAGQRRVRAAPNLAYDSPIVASDNLRTADDTDIFNGS